VLLTPITFTNCTFTGNSSNQGAALYFFQTGSYDSAEPTDVVTDSLCGQNTSTDSTIAHSSADLAVTYSCLSDGSGGGSGNISSCSPTFVDANAADNVFGTADDNAHLSSGAQGVNASLNSALGLSGIHTDLDGAARINGTVDMGAYELP
jgi:hypothetical protein